MTVPCRVDVVLPVLQEELLQFADAGDRWKETEEDSLVHVCISLN